MIQRTVEQRQALDNSDLAVQLMRIRQEANSQEGGIWEYRYQLYAGKAANLAEVASASRQAGEELARCATTCKRGGADHGQDGGCAA